MMRKLWVGGVLAGMLLAGVPALAQTPPTAPSATTVRPRMLAMRGRMLRERVGLDEATAQRVERVLTQFDAQQAAVREQIRTHQRRMRQLVRGKSTDEAAYRQAVDGFRAAQRQQQALLNREFDELKKILQPSQQARLLLQLRRLNRGGAGVGVGPGAAPGRGGGAGPGQGPCGAGAGPCGRGQGRGRVNAREY